jgi:hypothetical protein
LSSRHLLPGSIDQPASNGIIVIQHTSEGDR